MAIARAGPLVQAISGSLGSLTFSNARASLVVRPRPMKVNQLSKYQIAQRGKYSFVVSAWKTLSDLQKQGWRNLARLTPTVNALGQRRPLSAFQLFVKLNLLTPDPFSNLISDPPLSINTKPPYSIIWQPHENGPYFFHAYLAPHYPSSRLNLYGSHAFLTHEQKFKSNFRFLGSLQPYPVIYDLKEIWSSKLGALKEDEVCSLKVSHVTENKMPSPTLIATSVVDLDGFLPVSADFYTASKSLHCHFNSPIDSGASSPLEWFLRYQNVGYDYAVLSKGYVSIILSSPTSYPSPGPDRLSYVNTYNDIFSTTGIFCQTFDMDTFNILP